jgi:hypothetical protein
MVVISCPKCGLRGCIASPPESAAPNDNENMREFLPPEGFRKVQLGWRVGTLRLYCMTCGLPAEALNSNLG